MAGDKFDVKVSSWYKTDGASIPPPSGILPNIVAGFLSGSSGALSSTHSGTTTTQLQNSGVLTPNLNQFLGSQTYNVEAPKAYLNWVLLDEQFNFVASSSSSEQVPAESFFGSAPNNQVKQHVKLGLPIHKNGYLYVYVSNETPNIAVYFDNLQVTHTRGALLEETHYYPFGLTMAGISSKAAGVLENRKKYNGIEFNNQLELNTYEAFYRNLDPQTGRWWQIDPKIESMEMWSPYASMFGNPISNQDFLGDFPGPGDPPTKFDMKSLINFNQQNRGESTQIRKPIYCPGCKAKPSDPAFSLTISKGKQVGIKVAGVGFEVNGGSKEVFKVTSKNLGANVADKSKTTSGASLSIGIASVGRETETKSVTEKNRFGNPVTTTTTETKNSLMLGIKNTPLSAGIQNVETTTTMSNPFFDINSISQNSGVQYVGMGSQSLEKGGSTSSGTKFSVSAYYKLEATINLRQIAIDIFNDFNTGGH